MESSTIENTRPYVFDYVVGVLWVVAIATTFLRHEHILAVAKGTDQIASAATHVRAPDFAIGFLIVIAGVIVPYCVAAALRPITLVTMNSFLTLQRNRLNAAKSVRMELLRRSANARLSRIASIKNDIRTPAKLHFLALRAAPIELNLRAIRQVIDFRAALVMPVSLFFAGLFFRILDAHLLTGVSALIALAGAAAVYAAGVWIANKDLDRYFQSVDFAVLVAAAIHQEPGNKPRTAASSLIRTLVRRSRPLFAARQRRTANSDPEHAES